MKHYDSNSAEVKKWKSELRERLRNINKEKQELREKWLKSRRSRK